MVRIFSLVVMTKERVIESELQNDGDKRKSNGQERENPELACGQIARVHRNEHQPERAIDDAAYSEKERVLYCLLDLIVYRG